MSYQAQPYRRKNPARQPGRALEAMLAGKPLYRPHPKQSQRRLRKRRR